MNIDIGAVSGVLLTPCVCPVCGAVYAIPSQTFEAKKKNGGEWYCPNGHSIGFSKTRVDELEERVSSLVQENRDLENVCKELRRKLKAKNKKPKTKV